jgi:hypothetical protein
MKNFTVVLVLFFVLMPIYSGGRQNDSLSSKIVSVSYEDIGKGKRYGEMNILELIPVLHDQIHLETDEYQDEFETIAEYQLRVENELNRIHSLLHKRLKSMNGVMWKITDIPIQIGRYEIEEGFFPNPRYFYYTVLSSGGFGHPVAIGEMLRRTCVRLEQSNAIRYFNLNLNDYWPPSMPRLKLDTNIFFYWHKIYANREKGRLIRECSKLGRLSIELIIRFQVNNDDSYCFTFIDAYIFDKGTNTKLHTWKSHKFETNRFGAPVIVVE